MSLMSPDTSLVSDQISYAVWGAVVTSCKAFGRVKLNVHAETNRIFAEIELRWWARMKRLEPFRRFWIKRAEKAAKEYVPNGWRLLVYYAKESNGSDDKRSEGRQNKVTADPNMRHDDRAERSGGGFKSIQEGAAATSGGDEIEGRWYFNKGAK